MSKQVSVTRDLALSFFTFNKFDDGETTRMSGLVRAAQLLPFFEGVLDLTQSNPRTAAKGPITKDILTTIKVTPRMFPFYSKGILLGASQYKSKGSGEWNFTFDKESNEGLLDGGHTLLAIGMHVLDLIEEKEKLKFPKVKNWPTFAKVWEECKDKSAGITPQLDFFVQVEIVVPSVKSDKALKKFHNELYDICSARNNNKQLSLYTKSNQRGIYDGIRSSIDKAVDQNVKWRENAGGHIPAHSVVSLAWIPLNLLLEEEVLKAKSENFPLPEPIQGANIYANKGATLKRMNQLSDSLLGDWRESGGIDARRSLTNAHVHNAFAILRDLLRLHDLIYLAFPAAYNQGNKRFGTLRSVNKNESRSKIPERTWKHWATPFYRVPSCDFKDPYAAFANHLKGESLPNIRGRFNYPEGYITPLVYGLQSLMMINDRKQVVWRVESPEVFLKRHFDKIVLEYAKNMVNMGRDSQSVGKNAGNYSNSLALFERAFYKGSRGRL